MPTTPGPAMGHKAKPIQPSRLFFFNHPPTEQNMSQRLRTFIRIASLYRQHHSAAYAARIAHGIVYQSLPF